MTDQRDMTPDDLSTHPLPAGRTVDLVTTGAGDELIVYDLRTHHIHHLNATAAAIWRLCDGRRTIAGLTRDAGHDLGAEVDAMTVRIALTRLDQAALLDRPLPVRVRLDLPTRRAFLRRAAGSGLIALPVIASMTAPAAAQMVSQPDPPCKAELQPCATEVECCLEGSTCVESVNGTYYGVGVCHLADIQMCKNDDEICTSSDQCCLPNRECTTMVHGQEQADAVCRPIFTCKANREICGQTSDCCDPASICTEIYDGAGWHADMLCIPQ